MNKCVNMYVCMFLYEFVAAYTKIRTGVHEDTHTKPSTQRHSYKYQRGGVHKDTHTQISFSFFRSAAHSLSVSSSRVFCIHVAAYTKKMWLSINDKHKVHTRVSSCTTSKCVNICVCLFLSLCITSKCVNICVCLFLYEFVAAYTKICLCVFCVCR